MKSETSKRGCIRVLEIVNLTHQKSGFSYGRPPFDINQK